MHTTGSRGGVGANAQAQPGPGPVATATAMLVRLRTTEPPAEAYARMDELPRVRHDHTARAGLLVASRQLPTARVLADTMIACLVSDRLR